MERALGKLSLGSVLRAMSDSFQIQMQNLFGMIAFQFCFSSSNGSAVVKPILSMPIEWA